MRVVVGGVAGDVTSCVIDELARRGHEVSNASRQPEWLFSSSRGERSCGAAVDALVHIASVADRCDDADVDAMLDAARSAAVPRVVVISSALAPRSATEDFSWDGDPRWRTDTSPTSVLLIRATCILDREATGISQRWFAGPIIVGVEGERNVVQFIHRDDLVRFAADAVERQHARTGLRGLHPRP